MAPHRQWCFTLEKGTHWYEAPKAAYAPLYQFVRKHPELFRQTITLGPLTPPTAIPRTFITGADREASMRAGERQSGAASGGERVALPAPGRRWIVVDPLVES